jgi:hypothetical protein
LIVCLGAYSFAYILYQDRVKKQSKNSLFFENFLGFFLGRACPHHARPRGFGFKALNAKGFAARRLRWSFSVYQASQADNRFFLTIELDACGLRCPHSAQAANKAVPALHYHEASGQASAK